MKHAASTNSAKNLELNDGMVVDGTNTGVLNQPLTPAEVESKVDGEDQKSAVLNSQAASPQKLGATANSLSKPIDSMSMQMIDERNKRGRPPKQPKLPEVEQQG